MKFPLCLYFSMLSKHFISYMKTSHCSISFRMGYHWDDHDPNPYDFLKFKWFCGFQGTQEMRILFNLSVPLARFLNILKECHISCILNKLRTSNPSWDLDKILPLSLFLTVCFQRSSPCPHAEHRFFSLCIHHDRDTGLSSVLCGSFTIDLGGGTHMEMGKVG